MRIFVYAEDLDVYTSGTPSREMLRELIRIRSSDRFTLGFRRRTEQEKWVRPYLESLPTSNVEIDVLKMTRRQVNLRRLLRIPMNGDIDYGADLYMRFDAGTLGPHAHPLIALVTDLSSFSAATSSLAWHGRILYKRALAETVDQAERIVAISRATQNDLTAKYPACRERVRVIENGIADEWFRAPSTSGAADGGYWVWYGQMTARKNLEGLVAAYALLVSERNDIPRIKIVGRMGQGGEGILQAIAQYGLANQVEIVSPLPLAELVAIVGGSRGLVFPSFHEGFGMPIVEAMAQGRPVLTSNVTAMPEVAGGHAVLCDPHSTASIKAGLIALMSPHLMDPEQIEARKNWAARFTSGAAAEAYSTLIDEVMGQSNKWKPARPLNLFGHFHRSVWSSRLSVAKIA